jgi:serine/threonine-protein kinase
VAIANSNDNPPATTPQSLPTTTGWTTYPTYSSPSTSSYVPPPDPLQQLQALRNQDSFSVNQVADQWIPQLSSKHGTQPWTYDSEDRITYTPQAILQEHQRLRAQYGAKLTWSGAWTTFDAQDYWVTVVPQTFSNAADALSWCTRSGLDNDHCSAQILSTTRGSNGTHAHNN